MPESAVEHLTRILRDRVDNGPLCERCRKRYCLDTLRALASRYGAELTGERGEILRIVDPALNRAQRTADETGGTVTKLDHGYQVKYKTGGRRK